MADRAGEQRKALRRQAMVINKALERHKESSDKITREELCTVCLCKSKNCYPCRAFKKYSREVSRAQMMEAAIWN